jgi:serine O-acetyltransferase
MRRLFAVSWHAARFYRLANRLHRHGNVAAARAVAAVSRSLTGVDIAPGATFGSGLVVMHGHGIFVDGGVQVGRDCQLFQQVALGKDGAGRGSPTLGDRVVVFAGAKIVGAVTIGDDVVIGANAVVVDDVPAGAVAVGVPARIIPASAERMPQSESEQELASEESRKDQALAEDPRTGVPTALSCDSSAVDAAARPQNRRRRIRTAVWLYRAADLLHRHNRATSAYVVAAVNRILSGVEIEPGAAFGHGLLIFGSGTVVNHEVRVGSNCRLLEQVTLGVNNRARGGSPVLGDRVVVLAGAKILGAVTIGDDAVIGANAVVLCDVPTGAKAVGVPARVIPGSPV